jgi:cytochrome c556
VSGNESLGLVHNSFSNVSSASTRSHHPNDIAKATHAHWMAVTHPAQLVTKRRALFKQFTRTLEPMGMVARDSKAYNPREFKESALELEKLATLPWGYFTPDSNYPPTHAKPAVWLQASEFKQAQENYQATVSQLMQAAEGGNLEAIRTAVTGVQYGCKTCHNQFRKDY